MAPSREALYERLVSMNTSELVALLQSKVHSRLLFLCLFFPLFFLSLVFFLTVGQIGDASPTELNDIVAAMVVSGMFSDDQLLAGGQEKDVLAEAASDDKDASEDAGSVSRSPPTTWRKVPVSRPASTGVRSTNSPLLGRKQRSASNSEGSVSSSPVGAVAPIAAPQPVGPTRQEMEQRLQRLLREPLNSPEVVKFVHFLESVYATENFYFLRDVHVFVQECDQGASAKVKERKAKKLYEEYFAKDSPKLINCPHRASAPVVNRFGPLPSNVFNAAVHSVQQNLQDDILVRYLKQDLADSSDGVSGNSSPTASTPSVDSESRSLNPLLGMKKRLAGQTRRKSDGTIQDTGDAETLTLSHGSDVAKEGMEERSSGEAQSPDAQDSPPLSPAREPEAYESLQVTKNPLLAHSTPQRAESYDELKIVANPLLRTKK